MGRMLMRFNGAVISIFLCLESKEAQGNNVAARIIAGVGYKSAYDVSSYMRVCVCVLQIGFSFVYMSVCGCARPRARAHGNGSCT